MGKKSKKGVSRAGRSQRPASGKGRATKPRSKSFDSENRSIASQDASSSTGLEAAAGIGGAAVGNSNVTWSRNGTSRTANPPSATPPKDVLVSPVSTASETVSVDAGSDGNKENSAHDHSEAPSEGSMDAVPPTSTVPHHTLSPYIKEHSIVMNSSAVGDALLPHRPVDMHFTDIVDHSEVNDDSIADIVLPHSAVLFPFQQVALQEPTVEDHSEVEGITQDSVGDICMPPELMELIPHHYAADVAVPDAIPEEEEPVGQDTTESTVDAAAMAEYIDHVSKQAVEPPVVATEEPDVFERKLRDVTHPDEPAVLDVTMEEATPEKAPEPLAEKKDLPARVEPRGFSLTEPAPEEAGMKQKDCACVIL